jgi:RNA polymerase sigma-70 factor (ECF subfamily)
MTAGPISEAQAARFRRLAWPEMAVVLRTAQCLVRDPAEAEDLAQETMVKAMRAIDTYAEGTDIRAWLLTILRRTHIDRLRSRRARPNEMPIDEAMIEAASGPSESAGEYDERWAEPEQLMNRFEDEAVVGALRELPEAIRWTLLLVDVERIEQAEAAEVLGVAVGTIKSRAHRGRAMLRDRLHQLAVQRGWVRQTE